VEEMGSSRSAELRFLWGVSANSSPGARRQAALVQLLPKRKVESPLFRRKRAIPPKRGPGPRLRLEHPRVRVLNVPHFKSGRLRPCAHIAEGSL
jgi:hypothetical protein